MKNAGTYPVQNGIPYHTVNWLLNHKLQNISYDMIEKLCFVCNCTPNELFVWSDVDRAGFFARLVIACLICVLCKRH
ncbi:MAG: helix-turn-helix transcriptional regulator [Chitinophagaceae bacterium]|nr:helix-turn-helix transcriptional regulator [Chitinophagaceae bacterium]MBK8310880.1 helix-turn-helix transcriptional regulator [Chitinophagaceae bacterium]MBK8608262.1 helix-turn-helix transcriptional regulator [Chitinophagaceae bacterium]MBP6477130.1 helix-turn-helix transcriptional regulator [Chitinophagaceae bacterium]MBP7313722.1 helix-turn-helix transcriptional regulator [Chitinophagaceae bacterium]